MLQLTFKPESEAFEYAIREYIDIWTKDADAIIKAFEDVTGLQFIQKEIKVLVMEGPSFSGSADDPMRLRASYSHEVKKGTLVHELGHRLIEPMSNRVDGVDEHRTLNIFLYDVWTKLYGSEFADMMVTVESKRKGIYDYEGTWQWFLRLNEEEKTSLWNRLLSLNSR